MKAILVINEMPNNCGECKLINLQGIGESICNAVDWSKRPSWCPLRPLPEKKKHEEEIDYDYGYIDGWNDCLEELEK